MSDEPSAATSLQLYQLAVEMADRISVRRGIANSFFLTLQTALLGTFSLVGTTQESGPVAGGAVVVACAGLVLCSSWWVQLRSYRDLNRAKFSVILQLERDLPFGLFGPEWQRLLEARAHGRWRYTELGTVERLVPIVFAVLHLCLLALRTTT